jgi:hypothetical protein
LLKSYITLYIKNLNIYKLIKTFLNANLTFKEALLPLYKLHLLLIDAFIYSINSNSNIKTIKSRRTFIYF